MGNNAKLIIFCVILTIISIVPALIFRETADERVARALAHRIVPDYVGKMDFRQTEDTADVFEVFSEKGKIVIAGNNANSMAMGLNHYLKNHCGVTVSWYAYEPVQYPAQMPSVDEKVRVEARVKDRFFLNYCTFGYTMPWWKWEDWERLIDWMALNGINMPLANTGQEAVWQKVWRKHGMTDEQIRSYFTGPAHLGWHRMCNIDHFDGPLPQEWIDSQVILQKKILKRERQLNMRPVLSAFGGHVPEQLKEIYPDAQISDIPRWSGFPADNLCHFLAPMDPLYAQIQREYMQEQEKMFGTDHIYGVDLFNEVEAPSWDPETLAAISKGAYESMSAVDPDAVWLQMGWMFYYDQKHWTPENVKAYLQAVPQGKVVILDYYLEHTPVWTVTERFYGQPYILCYLGNFGGNIRLSGNFHQASERIDDAFARGGENFVGIGSTLEGFGINQFMYEYVFDKAWSAGISDQEWVRNLARRRTGKTDPYAERAWKTLADSVYIAGSFSSQTPLACARPCLEGYWHWTSIHNTRYDNGTLIRAWQDMLKASSDRDTYRSDVVNLGTQALGNHFAVLRDRLTQAYEERDLVSAEQTGALMLEALDDLDALAACDPSLRLDRWLDDASSWGGTPEEKAYYRRNARTLITIWGEQTSIKDYATRLWSGLIDSYYAPRWKMFIDEILDCIREDRIYDEKAFFERLDAFELDWAVNDRHIDYREPVPYIGLSHEILEKYGLACPKDISLLTYNVGTFSKYSDDSTPQAADLIRALGVDAVALNELDSCNRRHNVHQLQALTDSLGGLDHAFASAFPFAGGGYGNGVATSSDVIRSFSVALPLSDGAEPRSMAVVETLDYILAATHLDHVGTEARIQQVDSITAWCQDNYAEDFRPVILCGDMNCEPDGPAVKRLLESWDLLSCTGPTYPSGQPRQCLDYVFHLKSSGDVEVLESRVVSCAGGRKADMISYHLPVFVKFRSK